MLKKITKVISYSADILFRRQKTNKVKTMQGTIEQLEQRLTLGQVTWYNTSDFVDFGSIQTVYAAKGYSYGLNTVVNLYAIVGATLDPNATREYIVLEQSKPIF